MNRKIKNLTALASPSSSAIIYIVEPGVLDYKADRNGIKAWLGLGDLAYLSSVAANGLTGTSLASNVVTSSLTSLGTLGSLNVSGTSTIANTTWANNVAFTYGTGSAANHRNALGLGSLATQSGNISDYLSIATAATTYVPLTRTVNGQALSGDVNITTISGNAGSATVLATPITINSVSFDGSSNIVITASAGTLTGTTLNSSVTASSLTSIGILSSLSVTGTTTIANTTWGDNVSFVYGVGSAANHRTALGLVIGTNVQAYDADLDSWSGKTAPSGTVVGTSDPQVLTNKSINGVTLVSGGTATLYLSQDGTYTTPAGSVGGATDLTYTASAINGIIVSSTGTDATIPLGTGTNAGLLAPAEFTKLSNLSGTNTGDETGTSIRSKLGITTLSGSNTGDEDLTPFLTITDATNTYQPLATVLTSISGLTDGSGVLSNDGSGNLSWAASGGTGTVTSVSVVSANGFEGTVADPTTTPAITISTSIIGLLKGNGTSISSATADTDYLTPSTAGSTYVPVTRTVNGQALSGNIVVAAAAGTLTGTTLASNVTTASIRTMGDPASSALGNGLQIRSSLGDVNIFAGGIESTRSPFYINFAKQPFDLSDGALTIAADRTITAALPIVGSITGNASTVTTNASLTGIVTSVGNATSIADGAIALAKLATNPLARANHTGTQAATTITGLPCEFQVAASDLTTPITAGTNKAYFRAPFAFTLTAVRASVLTAGTGSTILIDINKSGVTVLSTKIMINAAEKTSTTAAIAPSISDAAIENDAELTIDFDQVGATIAGSGVIVTLIGTR